MSVEYSDDIFQDALRKLEARPKKVVDTAGPLKTKFLRQIRKGVPSKNEERQKKHSLHDIAALLQESDKSGLKFEFAAKDGGDQEAEARWNSISAEALLRSIRDADLHPILEVTQLCDDLLIKLREAIRMCETELPKVNRVLDSEDRRIAQIPAAQDAAGGPSRAYAGFGDVQAVRAILDQFDHAEGELSEAVKILEERGADIREYLLIDSAMEAALQISWKTPLHAGDVSAKAELDKLRFAIERLEAALKEVDALPGGENAARQTEK